MFSSNQILEFSGSLSHKDELKHAFEFAIKASGWYEAMTRSDNPCECVYQITEDGRYCIGWGEEKDGWKEFPFDFDIAIISQIIAKHLAKQEMRYDENCIDGWDGSYNAGFLMKVIPNSFASEKDGIKNPFRGIMSFEPYTCFYAK
jgi:hypothetical protein